MNDSKINDIPEIYPELIQECEKLGFTMPSDLYAGSFLKTLISSKPGGRYLELGTGVCLTLSWMIEGMDDKSTITTIDNDPDMSELAKRYFGNDTRVEVVCQDGSDWLNEYSGPLFDLIFADAWPGKYFDLDTTIGLLKTGGFYIIDDMIPQPNWPEGHEEKANNLISILEKKNNLYLTKMNWSTGIIMAVKK